jgi:ribose transport system substrate-binding protein
MSKKRPTVSGKRAAAAGAVGCALLLAAACSSSNSSSNGSTSAVSSTPAGNQTGSLAAAAAAVRVGLATPTSISQTVPLSSKPPAGKKVVYLEDPNPANTLGGKSLQAAVESAGWKFSTVTYNVADPATFQAAAETALAQGANYIAENGTPPGLLGNTVLAQIKAAGVKLVAASIYPTDNTSIINTDATNGARYASSARLLADWFMTDSDGKGNAIFENVTAYPVLSHAADAFQSEVQSDCPGCHVKLAAFSPADLQNGTIVPSLVSMLRQNPSYKYVFFDYSAFSTGIYTALAAAGLTDVKVGGLGIDSNVKAALQSGKAGAWIGTSFAYEGWAMADVIFRLATNTTTGFTQISTQPQQIFTPANASLLNSTDIFNNNDFNAPADALTQFETKIWLTR